MEQTGIIYGSKISGLRFSPSSSEDIRRESVVAIQYYDMLKNGEQYPLGPLDRHLGTYIYGQDCLTCGHNKQICLGHDGHLNMNYSVQSPMFVPYIKKWLRVICFKCGNTILKPQDYRKFPKFKRLKEAAKIAKTGKKKCPTCETLHPNVINDPKNKLIIISEDKLDKTKTSILFPHIIKQIFDRISDETVESLGGNVLAHPRVFILDAIKIPPITLRPDIRQIGGSKTSTGDITTFLQNIIKENMKVPPYLPKDLEKNKDMINSIYYPGELYHALVKGVSGKNPVIKGPKGNAPSSYSKNLKGKQGLFRKNELGKRVAKVARNTITGDSNRAIDEVGIPLKFAKILQIEETVQEYNKNRLMINFLNGKSKYPGCTKIIKKSTGAEHGIENISADRELELGDKLVRDLEDGDYVLFGRQPSLLASNISAMRVVINHDPSVITFTMNVLVCALFSADFDGDQMNIYVISKEAALVEPSIISTIDNWFIKHAYRKPMLGEIDDSIIGSFLLTRTGVILNRVNMMKLFGNVSYVPKLKYSSVEKSDKPELFSGRDAVSEILTETPINFKRTPSYYQQSLVGLINYDPSEIEVEIKHGKLLKGVLDKNSIGKGATGGLFHTIYSEFNEKKSLDTMFNLQQLAISYLNQRGFTIGILDFLIAKESLKKVQEGVNAIIRKSELITERLDRGEIIPPVGKTVKQHYEDLQKANLKIMDELMALVFESVDWKNNNLLHLIMSASKGSIPHFLHIAGVIGLIIINGERAEENFSIGRYLPFYPRFDTNPSARGFVNNCYIIGLTSWEEVTSGQNAINDLTTKQLYTSVTGESNRNCVMNLSPDITNNYRMTVKDKNIIQFLYGDDAFDTRKLFSVKFPTIMISDKQLEDGWHYRPKNSKLKTVFDEEFEQVMKDRKRYRDIYLEVEKASTDLITDKKPVPVDVKTVVDNIIYEHGERKPSEDEIAEMVQIVKTYCEGVPYVLVNEIQKKRKMKLPEFIKAGVWMLLVLVRSELNSERSLKKLNKDLLDMILDKITYKHSMALIDSGAAVGIIAASAFSEPLTQYMLDSHHRTTTGGTTKSVMDSVKETFKVKDTDALSAPTMILTLWPEYESRAQEIANYIETMKFVDFVSLAQIFFEPFGNPIHPCYTEEKKLISDFLKYNPLLRPPDNMLKWCIRFVLSRTDMIYKNMSLETIVLKLRRLYPELYIVNSPENAPNIVIRVYISNKFFDDHVEQDEIEKLRDTLLDTIIRGVSGIRSARVVKIARHVITEDGSIQKQNKVAIKTEGTNIAGIMMIKAVNPYEIQTDAVPEVLKMFGIEAARQLLVRNIRELGAGGLDFHHVSIYADEMTAANGEVTSIGNKGLGIRGVNEILLRMGFSSPMQTLETAAVNAIRDPIVGVMAPVMVGNVPEIGTAYNKFHVNPKIIREKTVNVEKYLDDI